MNRTGGLLRFDIESRLIAEREGGVPAFHSGDCARIARLYGITHAAVTQMRDRILYPKPPKEPKPKAPRHPDSARKIRLSVRALIKNGGINEPGVRSRLAEYFGVSRQRVGQVVKQEMAA